MRPRTLYYLVAAVIVFFAWRQYRVAIERATSGEDPPATFVDLPVERSADSTFRCDGRTRCPEMKSCEEAKYFLQNCPGTEMDGDQDGIPCEDQWCAHLR